MRSTLRWNAYLGIKYYPDNRNRQEIETLSEVLEKAGFDVFVVVRDAELWGEVKLTPQELMKVSFSHLQESSICILECSQKGVGLGVEAGYAHAHAIPVVILAKKGVDISTTLKGLANSIIYYEQISDLEETLAPILNKIALSNPI